MATWILFPLFYCLLNKHDLLFVFHPYCLMSPCISLHINILSVHYLLYMIKPSYVTHLHPLLNGSHCCLWTDDFIPYLIHPNNSPHQYYHFHFCNTQEVHMHCFLKSLTLHAINNWLMVVLIVANYYHDKTKGGFLVIHLNSS